MNLHLTLWFRQHLNRCTSQCYSYKNTSRPYVVLSAICPKSPKLHWQGLVTSQSLASPLRVIYWCLLGMNRSKAAAWRAINQSSNEGWQRARNPSSRQHAPNWHYCKIMLSVWVLFCFQWCFFQKRKEKKIGSVLTGVDTPGERGGKKYRHVPELSATRRLGWEKRCKEGCR